MPTDDVQIRAVGAAAVPFAYTVPGNGQLQPKAVNATFDGTGASGQFLPTLEIISDGGVVVARCPVAPSDVVAVAGSAEVSWFPGVGEAGAGSDVDVLPWPAGNPAHELVDNSSWANNFDGSGFYTALALDINNTGTVAVAGYQGDAFPFMLVAGPARNGDFPAIFLGDGSVDPVGGGNAAGLGVSTNSATHRSFASLFGGGVAALTTNDMVNHAVVLVNVNAVSFADLGTAVSPVQMTTGTGPPIIGGRVGDLYYRRDGGAGTNFYRCTVAGGDGAATWVGIL